MSYETIFGRMLAMRPREPRYTRADLTLANAFTGVRLVMIPIFGYLWAGDHDQTALWVFAAAVATDVIDGFLARYLNQKSRLGALLDPIADKFLMIVALLVGLYVGALPLWLAAIVIGRDLFLGIGALSLGVIWPGRHGPEAWRPTRVGKYAMFLQSSSILSAFVEDILHPPGFLPYMRVIMIMAALLTLVAGTQYFVRALACVALAPAPTPTEDRQ